MISSTWALQQTHQTYRAERSAISQLYCTGRAASALELKPSVDGTPDLANDVPTPEIIDGDREELPE